MVVSEGRAERAVAPYLLSAWYQAAWAEELDAGPISRTLLDTPLLLFRGGNHISALFDRCPHRFAPLSAGTMQGDVVECAYHGLAFDGSGRCVRNPHGPVTNAMRVRAFPVVERHYAVWVWFGEAKAADPSLIPNLSYIDDVADTARILMHMSTAGNYQLLTDNILDLSHADYLHRDSIGGAIAGAKARQYDRGNALVAEWINLGCDAPTLFQARIPSPAKADYWIEVEWQAPAVMTLANTIVPAGQTPKDSDMTQSLHNMVPETSMTSHYFMCSTRRENVEDTGITEMLRAALDSAFNCEDKPLIEAQQSRMGNAEFWSLRPILLQVDAAGVLARRRLAQLIADDPLVPD